MLSNFFIQLIVLKLNFDIENSLEITGQILVIKILETSPNSLSLYISILYVVSISLGYDFEIAIPVFGGQQRGRLK